MLLPPCHQGPLGPCRRICEGTHLFAPASSPSDEEPLLLELSLLELLSDPVPDPLELLLLLLLLLLSSSSSLSSSLLACAQNLELAAAAYSSGQAANNIGQAARDAPQMHCMLFNDPAVRLFRAAGLDRSPCFQDPFCALAVCWPLAPKVLCAPMLVLLE